MRNRLNAFVDTAYLTRFFAILLILYFGNLAFIAITDTNGRLYSKFLDEHLNYINWLRNTYLYTSSAMVNLLGYHSFPNLPYRISTPGGRFVQMVYDCLGIGFFSFWTAFVWANTARRSLQVKWWLAGLVSIWFINCIRIALLTIAVINNWYYNRFADHHTLYNLVAYATIAGFIVLYTRQVARWGQVFTGQHPSSMP